MLPADTNGLGNIFGGVLLDQMDQAGLRRAACVCNTTSALRNAGDGQSGVQTVCARQ